MPAKSRPDTFTSVLHQHGLAYQSTIQHLKSRETISYGVKAEVNPCCHVKFDQTVHPFLGEGRTVHGGTISPLCFVYSADPSAILSLVDFGALPEPDLRGVLQSAYDAKANDFSALNFLAELKDIPSILSGKVIADPVQKSLKKKIKGNRVQRDLGRLGVSLPLAQQFALGPLVSDIASFGSSMVQAQRSLQIMQRQLALPRRVFAERKHFINIEVDYGSNCKLRVFGSITKQVGGVVTGSLNMSPDIFRLKKMLDAVGLYIDGAVVWEAIPFSFLVDYVLPVGSWLESARDPWVKPSFSPRAFWSSVKAEVRFELVWDQPQYWVHPRNLTVATGTLKYYLRYPVTNINAPVRAEYPALRIPNPRQGAVVVGLALDKFMK